MKIFTKSLPDGFCKPYQYWPVILRLDEADTLKLDIQSDGDTTGQLILSFLPSDVQKLKDFIASYKLER
ncbi:MAG: hypothetical protein QXW75_00550 [Thermoplasmatales archaeon]